MMKLNCRTQERHTKSILSSDSLKRVQFIFSAMHDMNNSTTDSKGPSQESIIKHTETETLYLDTLNYEVKNRPQE